ncbi:galactose-binding domain-like protein [Umbelopsis sp. PMI_123]|nr:galactose-binding domain-like protein [Umbelopsis sp. PMI_123]
MGNSTSKNSDYSTLSSSRVEDTVLCEYVDLAAQSMGSSILRASDEFFGAAANILKPDSVKHNDDDDTVADGELDGWQTKRHSNREWAIIKLGCEGTITGFDIDTTNFRDSSPVQIKVEATVASEDLKEDDLDSWKWVTLLPDVAVKPDTHNLYLIRDTDDLYSHLRVTIIPDGGIARLRCFGTVIPKTADTSSEALDLAFIGNGGHIVACSDARYGKRPNILMSGIGNGPSDGWVTQRSRLKNRNDWIVVQLGTSAVLKEAVVDTTFFKGNAPEAIAIDGCYSMESDPDLDVGVEWVQLVAKQRINPNEKQTYGIPSNDIFTHVKLTVFPDGGIQRFRVIGTPKKLPTPTSTTSVTETTEAVVTEVIEKSDVKETLVVEKVDTVTSYQRPDSPSKLLVAEVEEEAIVSKTMENPFTEDATPKKKVSAGTNKKATSASKSASKKGNKRELVVDAEEEVVSVTNKRRGPSAASARKAPTDNAEEPLIANGETATTPPNKRVKRNL